MFAWFCLLQLAQSPGQVLRLPRCIIEIGRDVSRDCAEIGSWELWGVGIAPLLKVVLTTWTRSSAFPALTRRCRGLWEEWNIMKCYDLLTYCESRKHHAILLPDSIFNFCCNGKYFMILMVPHRLLNDVEGIQMNLVASGAPKIPSTFSDLLRMWSMWCCWWTWHAGYWHHLCGAKVSEMHACIVRSCKVSNQVLNPNLEYSWIFLNVHEYSC